MDERRKVLALIRNHIGDSGVGFSTRLANLPDEHDADLDEIVSVLEEEFGVTLDNVLPEAETIGELCEAVTQLRD